MEEIFLVEPIKVYKLWLVKGEVFFPPWKATPRSAIFKHEIQKALCPSCLYPIHLVPPKINRLWREGTLIPCTECFRDSTGIFSYKELKRTLSEMCELAFHDIGGKGCTLCTTSVEIWGQIIEHERGYRSQFVKIIEEIKRVLPEGP